MSRREVVVDPELGRLTRDRLTRDVWLFQREKGHRFSVDDVATAFVAATEAPGARRIVDLGCGIGSVLLHLAWSFPEARLLGVEAQAISFALLQRNVAAAGYRDRVDVHHGDLRDRATQDRLGAGHHLVTGTPPYFPIGTALFADDEQRAYARIERRGGVEAYVDAGAKLLGEGAPLVLCVDADARRRVEESAATNGLHVRRVVEIVPREGKKALFSIFVLRCDAGPLDADRLVVRDATGARTDDAARLRAFSAV